MNKKQMALATLYAGFHLITAVLCCVFTDPFGVFILMFGAPSAAAGMTAVIAMMFQLWMGKRRWLLPLVLLGVLVLSLEVVARLLYGYYFFEWLFFSGVPFLIGIQYICCLFPLLVIRRLIDRWEEKPIDQM